MNLLAFATQNLHTEFGRSEAAPHVYVQRRIGSSTWPRCVANEVDGFIVVLSVDDGAEVDRVCPGDWKKARVYDALGNLHAEFEAGR